jgi:O-antigen/teichoic acid export membrane protein
VTALDTPAATAAANRAAARSVSAIALNQIAQVAGSVLFVALVPRTLGTIVYGQLAFAFALMTILQMVGELGYQEIFSRYLPEVRQRQGEAGVRALVRSLFTVRAALGLALGVLSLLIAHVAADWLTPAQLVLIAMAVSARVWALGPFPLLLGLGETYKWSVETTWRQIVVTGLTLMLVRGPSLTLGLLAMTLHELVFLALGLWWVREWLFEKDDPAEQRGAGGGRMKAEGGGQKSEVGSQRPHASTGAVVEKTSDIRPLTSQLLRFGFLFSLANLGLVVLFRISPISVEWLTGSHIQTGFFDLALGGLLLIYTLLGQVAYAFVPILTQLHLAQQPAEADRWLGRVARYSTMLVALAVGGMWAVAAPLAPLLFGESFGPAADTQRMMAFALLPLPVAWAGVTLTAVERRPRRKLWAALAGLAAFAAAAVALREAASPGIALAFGLAMLGYAAGFGRSALHAVRAGGASWALALAGTAVFAPLFFTRFATVPVALGAWFGLACLYMALMLAARVARPAELRTFLSALRK